jgi:hypothetical protein
MTGVDLTLRAAPAHVMNRMTVIRVYSKVEAAYLDAAYLGGLGVESTVIDERGYGPNLMAAATSAIRLEVDDDRAEEARRLLRAQIQDTQKPPPSI